MVSNDDSNSDSDEEWKPNGPVHAKGSGERPRRRNRSLKERPLPSDDLSTKDQEAQSNSEDEDPPTSKRVLQFGEKSSIQSMLQCMKKTILDS